MLEIMSIGGSVAKPTPPKYAAFLDYMSRINLIDEDLSTGLINKFNASRGGHRRRVNMGKGILGSMNGSPWSNGTPSGTNIGRIIQHLCPSLEVFNRLFDEKAMVMLQPGFTSSSVASSLPGLTRNGYTSGSTSVPKDTVFPRMDTNPSLVYYDSVANELYSMYGSNKSGPTVWTIPT